MQRFNQDSINDLHEMMEKQQRVNDGYYDWRKEHEKNMERNEVYMREQRERIQRDSGTKSTDAL